MTVGRPISGDPRFANIERKVGLFVFAVLAAIFLTVAFIAAQQGVFSKKTTLHFTDTSGKDLTAGMAVKIKGFTVGSLREVRLNDEGMVEGTLAIRTRHMRWIRSDSVARLAKEMFIGDSMIEISPGSPGLPQIEPGGTVTFEREQELADVARTAMEEIKPVLLHVKSIVQYIEDPEGDFKNTVSNMNRLTSELITTRENLDRLANRVGDAVPRIIENVEGIAAALEEQIIPRLLDLLRQADRTMSAAEGAVGSVESFIVTDLEAVAVSLQEELLPEMRTVMESTDRAMNQGVQAMEVLNGRLPELLEKVSLTLDNIVRITDDLKKVSSEVPGMAEKGESILDGTQEMVESVRGSWPFGPAKAPEGERLEADSYERPE